MLLWYPLGCDMVSAGTTFLLRGVGDKGGLLMAQASVFVVDDDASMRSAIEALLNSASLESHLFASATAFLEQFDPNIPGCLVLDLRMPGMSGMELLEHLNGLDHQLTVLVITAYGDVPTAVKAMSLGATDFLEKPFSPPAFLDRVKHAAERAVNLNRHQEARRDALARFNGLTQREKGVLDLLLGGMSNKQVAFELSLSEKTVSAHRSHILEKTGAESLISLVHLMGLAGLKREHVRNALAAKTEPTVNNEGSPG